MAMEIAEAVMEVFSPSSVTDWLFTLSVVLLSVLCFFLVQKWGNRAVLERATTPPSPPKLPIIGNLHQLSKLHHRSLWTLAQKHGSIMFLQLGSIPTIVISSADMAEQVLRTRDNCCCSRPSSPGSKLLSYNFLDLAFAPYSDHWKEMRKLFNAKLLSPKRAESLWHAREVEVGRLISSISQDSPVPVDVTQKVFHLADGILGAFAFGKSYEGKQFRNQKFYDVLVEAMRVLEAFSAEDFFPTGGWIIDAMSGLRAKRKNCFQNLDGYFQMVIDDHLDPTRPKPEQEDLVDVFIRLLEDPKGPFQIHFLVAQTLPAITLDWTMSELMANPMVMNKLQAEVRSCIGSKPRVERDDLNNLKYLKMVIKEALRKHAPIPLLIPLNAWGIGRDPKIWKDPDVFYPERFEDCEIEFYGKHFELLPFGGGKRICPGANMGVITAEFTLANLVYCFDWELPSGMRIEDLGLEEELGGITAGRKKPLCLVARRCGCSCTEPM
ncbi:2-methylbutanal oxime monooxygenase [Vitis vinifera]|uniref:2-methylbutanal oxime monooxygenase n=1 Tax=Vitis vinifera TaxID=29760 RepID=A0A438G1Q4_VITVI|nr:2-methylbutanal oxime monooxygenase [Vitis vinifera]